MRRWHGLLPTIILSISGCAAEYDNSKGPVTETATSDGKTTTEVGPGGEKTHVKIETALPGPKVDVEIKTGPVGTSGKVSIKK